MSEACDVAGARGRRGSAAHAKWLRGARIIERLAAGFTLSEIAASEELSARRARELVAEFVARRGFDP